LHAWQTPAHAVSQQTPSVQKPELHSLPAAHATPLAFLTAHAFAPQ
jgi:hypothetical protein